MRRFSLSLLSPLLGGLLIMALLFALANYRPAEAQSGISNFTTVVASNDVIVGDDLVVGDEVIIGSFVRLGAAASASITNGATLTPTGTYQPLTSAGNVGFGSIAPGEAGQMLILINQANTTITISDTGSLRLSGNLALGQYDSATLISDGVNWIQLSTSNN